MQALAVYAIARLDEGDKDHYNVDALLLRAVTVSLPVQFIMQAPG